MKVLIKRLAKGCNGVSAPTKTCPICGRKNHVFYWAPMDRKYRAGLYIEMSCIRKYFALRCLPCYTIWDEIY